MTSLVEKFKELENLILKHRHTLELHAGVPFVLLIYEPRKEYQCRDERDHLKTKLEDNNLKIQEIFLGDFIFNHYDEIGLLDKIFEKEEIDPGVVHRDISKNYRPALAKYIIKQAKKIEEDDAVIFLTNVAHLYPFVRVSNLLEDLENQVKVPLIVFYPGEELDNEMRFLGLENADGPHTKYRARRI